MILRNKYVAAISPDTLRIFVGASHLVAIIKTGQTQPEHEFDQRVGLPTPPRAGKSKLSESFTESETHQKKGMLI